MPRDPQRVLRRNAEDQLRRSPLKVHELPKSARDLVHELQVHQVELQMQNDALRDAQLELERSRARYLELYEHAPVAYLSLDAGARILDANVAAVALLGRGKSELAGKALASFLPPEAAVRFELYRREVALSSGPLSCELVLLSSNGRRLNVRLESQQTDPSSQDWRMALIDVTETQRLARELQQAQRLEAVGTLASGIAHDFNNVLMAVLGCAEIALNRIELDSPGRVPIEQLQQVALRGRSVVAQLLTFARRGSSEPTRLELDVALKIAEPVLRQVLGAGITLELALEAKDAWVHVDGGQLEQILLNLAANARHAMPEGGRFRIHSRRVAAGELSPAVAAQLRAGPCVLLELSDSGSGMPPEVQARAFEPFFTTKPPGAGTGLGLSMVYGAVKQAEGHLVLQSAVGEGTTLRMYWPSVAGQAEQRRRSSVPPPRARGEAGSVLVVEDDRLVRLVIRHYLEQMGYEVLEAGSGEDALAILRTAPEGVLQLLVTDVVLPGMKGPQLVDEAQRMRPELAVLIVSAHEPDLLVERGWLAPGVSLLRKPFTAEELQDALRGVGLCAATPSAS